MNRKGFEVQFNWLFVLVAGAAILIFFTIVVAKQKNVSETSTKASVLKSIEAITTSAGISSDTINIVSIPESEIEIGCSRISVGGVSKQYQNLILFAPGSIKGSKIITQTLSFNVPYRTSNLLYITSPGVRYIIIGSSNLAKEVNKTLPSELKKEFYIEEVPIANSNNHKVRFVLFSGLIGIPGSLEKMRDEDVSALVVSGDGEKGAVEFYQKSGREWSKKGSSVYLGKNSLIGAVYSDTIGAYECSMQNTFNRMNMVTKIYAERTKRLIQGENTARQLQCNQFYSNALSQLNKMLGASEYNAESADSIAESAKILAGENKNAQIYSCTLIY